MLKEDKRYDLYGVLLSELMRNLKKIKKDKKHVFKFGSLIVYLALYLLNEILGIGKVQWAYDKPVAVQIKEYGKTFFFIVDKDQFHMEVVELRTIWIMPMGYDVDANTLDAYAQHLLSQRVDEKEERL